MSVPFERGSPDKNHSWDLMRSSWPGSSDPSQTAAAAQRREHRPGHRYLAWLDAPRSDDAPCGSASLLGTMDHGRTAGIATDPGAELSAESAGAERAARRTLATATGSTTKCVGKKKNRSVNNQKEGRGNSTKHQWREERKKGNRRSANWAGARFTRQLGLFMDPSL